MPDLETRMPELLRRAASGVAADPGLEGRVLRRARRRRARNAAAAGLTAVVLVVGIATGARELISAARLTPGDHSRPPSDVTPAHLPAIWPEVTAGALKEAQARADAGGLAWRLDPLRTAAAFATDVLGWNAADVRTNLSEWVTVGASPTVVVEISNARPGPAEGVTDPAALVTTLVLHQLGVQGEEGVWTVTSADSALLEIDRIAPDLPTAGHLYVEGRLARSIADLVDPLTGWGPNISFLDDTGELEVSETISMTDPPGSFTADLLVPTSLAEDATVGLLGAVLGPQGRVVAVDAFPYVVGSFGPSPIPPIEGPVDGSGPSPTGPTGSLAALPEPVLRTRDAILAAIRAGDFDALEALIDPDRFSYNFDDGSNPVPEWRKDPSVLDALALVLEMPSVTREGTPDVGTIYVWPSLTEADLEHPTDEERAMLAQLGLTEEDVRAMLESFGAYTGPRTGIAQDGTWLFYTVGGD